VKEGRVEQPREHPKKTARRQGSLGPSVDRFGVDVIDPTANVIALNEAAQQRQDDLRDLNDRRIDAALRHIEAIVALRADHMREINLLESNRLNAIRQVDVLAVSTAADRAQAAIQTLAVTTANNAENLRNALASTANTIAAQTAATVASMTERIAALEKSSYEGKGKEAVSDPVLAELVSEMKSLRASRSTAGGERAGMATMWAIVMAVVGLLVSVGGFAFVVVTYLRR